MEPANASDRKSIRRQAKAARLAERQREEVIASIMSTAAGRSWLWDMLSQCSIFHSTFVPDTSVSAFNEGRRSIGLAVLSDIMRACPDSYILAMREANERYIRPDPDANALALADSATAAERRSGPLTDGGDSGALAADDPDAASVDYDIYRTETPGQ